MLIVTRLPCTQLFGVRIPVAPPVSVVLALRAKHQWHSGGCDYRDTSYSYVSLRPQSEEGIAQGSSPKLELGYESDSGLSTDGSDWGYSSIGERYIRNVQVRVRFSVAPPFVGERNGYFFYVSINNLRVAVLLLRWLQR